MTVTKAPLSLSEKNTLKRMFYFRLLIGFLFILPIIVTTAYYCAKSIFEIGTYNFDLVSLSLIGAFMVCSYLFFKLVVPFYKVTFKNIRVKNKLIIETRILDIKMDYTPEFGASYVIKTESHEPIISSITSLLNHNFSYRHMQVNMRIRIHCLENNTTDILFIEPAD